MGKYYKNRQWALTADERKHLVLYTNQCRRLTKLSRLWVPQMDENTVCDHNLSIKIAWYIRLPIDITCSPCNLEFISEQENNRKSIRCTISIGELIVQHNEWSEANPEKLEQFTNKTQKILEKYPELNFEWFEHK